MTETLWTISKENIFCKTCRYKTKQAGASKYRSARRELRAGGSLVGFKNSRSKQACRGGSCGRRSLQVGLDTEALTSLAEGAEYEATTGTIWIKTPDKSSGLEVRVTK